MKTAAIGLLNLVLLTHAAAQAGPRDPMQPPAAPRATTATGGPGATEPPPLAVARHLMVVDGVRYVIDNGRRRGVGDLLGGGRIERIEDSAIVVRNGKQLQRLPLFTGVVKRSVAESASATASISVTATAPTGTRPADPATRTAKALVACGDTPPCMQRPGDPR